MADLKVPCEVYSRVCGYFRPVKQWNNGMKAQFENRVMYKLEKDIDNADNN